MTIPRLIFRESIEATARLVESWGYWRRISREEIEDGCWIEDEAGRGVVWFVASPEPGAACVHGMGAPDWRGWAYTAEVQGIVRLVACLLGYRRLYAPLPEGSASLMRYLTSQRGWKPAESLLGPFLELGG